MKTINIFFSLLFINQINIAQPGTLDSSFGRNGKVHSNFRFNVFCSAVKIQPDKKIIVGGTHHSGLIIARYKSDGSVDSSFGGRGFVKKFLPDATCRSILLTNNGKIIASGSYNKSILLIQYSADGTIDSSFGVNGIVISSFGYQDYAGGAVLQPDGKIVVGGNETRYTPDLMVARFNSNGTVDSSFGTNGKTTSNYYDQDDRGNSILLQKDGKIVLVGKTIDDECDTYLLARYDSTGKIDLSFGTNGLTTTLIGECNESGQGGAFQAALQNDGKIVAQGLSSPDQLFYQASIARYKHNGSLDSSFNNTGAFFVNGSDYFNAIAVQPNNKIITAGGGIGKKGNSDFCLYRYKYNGTLDSTFGTNGKAYNDFGFGESVAALAIQTDGKIIAAGTSTNHSTNDNHFVLARYNGDPLSRITRIKRWIKHHILNWQDLQASTNNTVYYSLERSYNSSSGFTEIAHISASENTKRISQNNYNYLLPQATIEETTRNYYRIKAVDKDGVVAYSDVIADQQTNQLINQSTIQLYPNPVKDVLHVSGLSASSNTSLSILNAQGNVLTSENVNADSYDLNVSQLKLGTYYLRIATDGKVNTQKFFKE